MDTKNINSAIEYIITNINEVINDNSYTDTKENKLSFYKKVLELNQKLCLFNKITQFPNVEYSLIPHELSDKFFDDTRTNYFKPIDYQFSFLIFLFFNYEKYNEYELRDIINDYIEKVKHQFKIKDIERTETGAVRCITNLRFALMNLRELGLLKYYSKNAKRTWTPTLLGFFVCCFAATIPTMISESNKYSLNYLKSHEDYIIDSRLVNLIEKLCKPGEFQNLINILEIGEYNLSTISQLEILLKEYSTFLNKNMDLCLNKKISKKEFETRFHEMLNKVEKNNDFEDFKNELIDITTIEIIMEKVNKLLNLDEIK